MQTHTAPHPRNLPEEDMKKLAEAAREIEAWQ
jgi:hypothetical protein